MTSQATATGPVFNKLAQLMGEFKEQGWDKAWKENVTPWDAGALQPPLRDLILSDQVTWPRKGRALVPGCGRGYDPIFIAATLGLDTLALDISTTALQAARELLASSPKVKDSGTVSFREEDFFKLSAQGDEKFDLIYDYTFFVAIPPSMRADWGRQMNALVKPGGYLITLIFPIDPPKDTGPPFFVRPEHYIEPLGKDWEKVIDKVPEVSSEEHVGRERLVVWKKL